MDTSPESLGHTGASNPVQRPETDHGIKAVVRFGVKLVLTVAVVTAIFTVVGWGAVAGALLQASWPWLLLMYALSFARQWTDAALLQFLLRRVGARVGLTRVFLASQLASFYSLLVPGEIASSAAKWANLAAATRKRSLVFNAMVYTKLLFLLVPVMIGSVALAIDNPLDSGWLLLAAVALLTVLVLLMLSMYHPRLGEISNRFFRRSISLLPARLATKAGFVLDSMVEIRSLDGRDHLMMVGVMFFGVGLGIARFYAGLRALGIDVPLVGVLWVIAFLGIGRLLPLTIANLGIREGLLVFALSAFNVPAEKAVALGLLTFSAVVLLTIIGGMYQVTLVAGWSRSTRPTSDEFPNTPNSAN